MLDLRRIEPKLRHCGRLSRILRHEHMAASLGVGESVHRQIRQSFVASYMVRGWAIDGEVSALAGVLGAALSPSAFIWMAIAQRFTRYPKYVVKEARAMMDEIMLTKLELHSSITGDDPAALRFAIHVGFHVDGGLPAFGRDGRRLHLSRIKGDTELLEPHGRTYQVPLLYAPAMESV
jgi:hypothetical protein